MLFYQLSQQSFYNKTLISLLLALYRQLNKFLSMCGNDVSTISIPQSGDFHTIVNPQLPTRKINLKNYPLSEHHVMQLNTLNLAGIRELNIEKCRLNHQTMQALSRVRFPVLTKLNLSDNELGPIGCRVLAGSSLLGRLTELNLNNNKLKDIGVKALANADLQAIEDLSLNDNSVTAEGLSALGGGKLSSIQCLSLGGNKLNDKSVALINSINPENIYFLKLSRNQFTDQGLKQLISQNKQLDVLLIQRNKIKEKRDKFDSKNLFLFY